MHDKGVDVLGLVLGMTDTPALRQLEFERGVLGSEDDIPTDAASVADVIAEAFDNLQDGPTWFVGDELRGAVSMMGSITRNQAVQFMVQASAANMGE